MDGRERMTNSETRKQGRRVHGFLAVADLGRESRRMPRGIGTEGIEDGVGVQGAGNADAVRWAGFTR